MHDRRLATADALPRRREERLEEGLLPHSGTGRTDSARLQAPLRSQFGEPTMTEWLAAERSWRPAPTHEFSPEFGARDPRHEGLFV